MRGRRTLARMLDANLNRAGEGLRVAEDLLRFGGAPPHLSADCRKLRHAFVRAGAGLLPAAELLAARRTATDPGRRRTGSVARSCTADALRANFRRAEESARVLEEGARLLGRPRSAATFMRLRYALYGLEARAA